MSYDERNTRRLVVERTEERMRCVELPCVACGGRGSLFQYSAIERKRCSGCKGTGVMLVRRDGSLPPSPFVKSGEKE